ncbi:Uncharacterised protein [BD1-7 clade bacterium]|uniref:DUF676 domain-containing protein n=1 Tax=BD1-7 clade bacterium TaxID=2029982 RepID=A0A5S9PGA0_9GAMM|nr:Uncharacterised protein [BD1-7 clade bacterium]
MYINRRIAAAAAIGLPLMAGAMSSQASLPGIPECSSALTFINGCQVNVVGPYGNGLVTARLLVKQIEDPNNPGTLINPTILTDEDAESYMSKLVIGVDGLTGSSDLYSESQRIANELNLGALAIDYQYDPSLLGRVEDLSAAFAETVRRVSVVRGDEARPAVVFGVSLGGIIARYGLRSMEINDEQTNISAYFSYDSPHEGVFVPQGIQNIPTMLQFTKTQAQNVKNGINIGPIKVGIDLLRAGITQAELDAQQSFIDDLLGTSFTSDLGKQLVIDNIHGNGEYDAFMADLDSMGLPQQSTNYAITAGNFNGVAQDAPTLSGGRFYHFIGRIGEEVTHYSQLDYGEGYLQAEFALYPTKAGQNSIFAGASGTRKDRPCFLGVCWDNYATFGLIKGFPAPSDAKEYDAVPGGWVDFSEFLSAANTIFEDRSDYVVVRHEPEYKFALIPVYSALGLDATLHDYSQSIDVEMAIENDAILFDQVYSVGNGANIEHSNITITAAIESEIQKQASRLSGSEKLLIWLNDPNNDYGILRSIIKDTGLLSSRDSRSLAGAIEDYKIDGDTFETLQDLYEPEAGDLQDWIDDGEDPAEFEYLMQPGIISALLTNAKVNINDLEYSKATCTSHGTPQNICDLLQTP